jgi:1,4-alpha-glucan branching enzyme
MNEPRDTVPALTPFDLYLVAEGRHYRSFDKLGAHPCEGHHPDWNTLVFNYGRAEVRNFLISNALFWIEKYHIDGLRVDAVASMLWNQDTSLDWHLAQQPLHAGLRRWVRDLNRLYRDAAPLHERDSDAAGFEWIDCNDHARSVVSFIRRGTQAHDTMLFVCNFTPVPRLDEPVGVPSGGWWRELLNSDATDYDGSGVGNRGGVHAEAVAHHGRPWRVQLALPPLGVVVLRCQEGERP